MKNLLSIAAILATLTGCVTIPTTQEPAQLRATHGYAHLSLIPSKNPISVTVQSIKDGNNYLLAKQTQHGPFAHGLWLPPGEYAVNGMYNPDGSRYLTFVVEQGRLTNLGGLVHFSLGGYETVLLPIEHPEIIEETQRAIGTLRPHLVNQTAVTWRPQLLPKPVADSTQPTGMGLIVDLLMHYQRHVNKPPFNEQLKQSKSISEFFQHAITASPPQTDEPASDQNANLYYGANVGQIRVRSNDKRWTSIDTGTLQALMAVEVSNNLLLAGTAHGQIRGSQDGKTWKKYASLGDDEAVLDIDRIGNRWMILSSKLTPMPQAPTINLVDTIKIHTATKDDLSDLSLLRTLQLPEQVMLFNGMGIRGQSGANVYYINSGKELHKLDLATLQWSSISLPHTISGYNVSAKTGVLTAYLNRGMFSKLNVSSDGGQQWRPTDTPPYTIYDVYFESATQGKATRWSAGAFTATIEFLQYNPSDNTWQKTHEAPQGCVRLLRDSNNFQRFCLTSGGSILDYVDGQWIVEFGAN